ncbi:MAG: DNA repair protein RadA [Clostridiales bacterium]|nr:DNA repair protein RadA [Clostridiales bacterium]
MKAGKTIYICSECEYQSAKWQGKCPSCGSWNTLEEGISQPKTPVSPKHVNTLGSGRSRAAAFDELDLPEYMRCNTGFDEFDRVLGGGLVHGSVILLSGEPGIGKSTLLMQISSALAETKRVLYISGEESRGQLKLRARRLGIGGKNLLLLTETNIDAILSEYSRVAPDIMIVDSIQTVYNSGIASAPGSISQVREGATAFISKAKNDGTSVIFVGHVNKEGGISGPKVLEHMVDAVLYFEGERRQSYRIIRAMKNRYGSTNEIGVFEMTDIGLSQVSNPSEMLLADRPKNTSGNCAVCVMEGSRPILSEIQALVSKTVFPAPRRTANGIDYNRMCLLIAVLEKRLGLRFSANDVYMNVIGGIKMDEPAADLATALALVSGITDRVVPDDLLAIGEIGLAGECRAVSHIEHRIKEVERLGFKKILIPHRNIEKLKKRAGNAELIGIKSIYEILTVLKPVKEQAEE